MDRGVGDFDPGVELVGLPGLTETEQNWCRARADTGRKGDLPSNLWGWVEVSECVVVGLVGIVTCGLLPRGRRMVASRVNSDFLLIFTSQLARPSPCTAPARRAVKMQDPTVTLHHHAS